MPYKGFARPIVPSRCGGGGVRVAQPCSLPTMPSKAAAARKICSFFSLTKTLTLLGLRQGEPIKAKPRQNYFTWAFSFYVPLCLQKAFKKAFQRPLEWLGNSYCTQGGGLSGYNKASGGLVKPLKGLLRVLKGFITIPNDQPIPLLPPH